jgi:hypothetical protein
MIKEKLPTASSTSDAITIGMPNHHHRPSREKKGMLTIARAAVTTPR